MPDITIPDLDDELRQRLEQRAARHGRSMQAEARDILRHARSIEPSAVVRGNIVDAIRAIVESLGGIKLAPFPRQPLREPPTFEEASLIVHVRPKSLT